MPFANRNAAGKRLAEALTKYKGADAVVLALPRGGLPVAAEIAAALNAPLDVILVRKIGVPYQPELAMGAIVDGAEPLIVRNENVIALSGISETEFKEARDREIAEIERRRRVYLGDRKPIEVAGKVAIVVDDGIATGATAQAALRATRRRNPKTLVLAVPVAPTDTLKELRPDVDDVICLEDYENFGAISLYYSEFRQLTDREVIDLLKRAPTEQNEARLVTKS